MRAVVMGVTTEGTASWAWSTVPSTRKVRPGVCRCTHTLVSRKHMWSWPLSIWALSSMRGPWPPLSKSAQAAGGAMGQGRTCMASHSALRSHR